MDIDWTAREEDTIASENTTKLAQIQQMVYGLTSHCKAQVGDLIHLSCGRRRILFETNKTRLLGIRSTVHLWLYCSSSREREKKKQLKLNLLVV